MVDVDGPAGDDGVEMFAADDGVVVELFAVDDVVVEIEGGRPTTPSSNRSRDEVVGFTATTTSSISPH
ncbi:hypothetical protein [Lentzea sp. NPDC060358]|uniref:hypothetical protein n=1 Tax=Lentzea sp. NPDC060358 TaxID=3347103 RepID=UPI00365B16E6